MRIGLVVPGFSADAQDWCIPVLRNLVEQLAATDDVRVLALRYPHRAGQYDLFGARVTALGGGQRRGPGSVDVWRQGLSALIGEHRRRRFDVLHAFWANEAGLLTVLAGRILRVPTLVSLAGGELVGFRDIAYGGQLARIERVKVALALRLADRVTAGSRYMLNQAGPWLRGRRNGTAHRVPLGVDLELFHPRAASGDQDPTRLIHVASLAPIKDQSTLLLAMGTLRDRGVAATLEIIGDGPLEPELAVLAKRLGLSGRVQLRGAVRHDQLPSVYNRGSVFVLSSRHEAQGMAPLEAAACGVPVVGTAVGVVPELAPQAGAAVPVGDHVALAESLAGLLSDRRERSALRESARMRAESEFGLDRCVRILRGLYANEG